MNVEWEAAYGVTCYDGSSEDAIVPESQARTKKQSQKYKVEPRPSRDTSCDQAICIIACVMQASRDTDGVGAGGGPKSRVQQRTQARVRASGKTSKDTDSGMNLKCRTPTTAVGLLNWQYPRPHGRAARHRIIFLV
jgi:hypothetical protein